jgi:hypothetical protein
LAEFEVSPPIGTNLASKPRSSTTINIPPDSRRRLMRDGLVERRGESLDVGLNACEARSRSARRTSSPDVMRHLVGGIVRTTSP